MKLTKHYFRFHPPPCTGWQHETSFFPPGGVFWLFWLASLRATSPHLLTHRRFCNASFSLHLLISSMHYGLSSLVFCVISALGLCFFIWLCWVLFAVCNFYSWFMSTESEKVYCSLLFLRDWEMWYGGCAYSTCLEIPFVIVWGIHNDRLKKISLGRGSLFAFCWICWICWIESQGG